MHRCRRWELLANTADNTVRPLAPEPF
jgi:hypothetical protein